MNLRDVHAFARGLPAPYPTLGTGGTFVYVPPGDPYGTGISYGLPSEPSYWFSLQTTAWGDAWGGMAASGANAPPGYYVTGFASLPDPEEQAGTGGT